MTAVRVALPMTLRTLAGVGAEVVVDVPDTSGVPTIQRVLDALEAAHPALRGTIRDQGTAERRAFMRYFACGCDLSHQPAGDPLPDAVAQGEEPFRVIGAISGG